MGLCASAGPEAFRVCGNTQPYCQGPAAKTAAGAVADDGSTQAEHAAKYGGPLPFTDVKESDYFYGSALWAYDLGIKDGSVFDPSKPCTRASAVLYMWKAAGSPTSTTQIAFTDVPADAEYAQAVAWALEQGITNGTSATTFSPDDICTRGHIVTFLYRYLAS